MNDDLSELIKYAFEDTSNQLKTIELHFLELYETLFFEELLSDTTKTFKRTVDNYAIVHTHNKHGQETKEISRGQIAVTMEDYLLIPVIVKKPDVINLGEKSNIGTDLIKYEKEIDGICYFYVEEVRKKRKSLAMKTLYKRKASTK
jgi:phage-Barnase-EndoU-ColicinE5/D-RelE like nuclease3